ncbi:hypothetical protein [Pantoea sp. WEP]|uniref:hypothetical protein n=1 Tax=Pantoea sp. WEP TaxID=3230025 RepID=UPI0035675AB4
MISFIKRHLNKIGSLLALCGLLFLGIKLHNYSLNLTFGQIPLEKWFLFALLTLTYGVLCLLNAFSWKYNLGYCKVTITTLDSISIYGVSQLAKYLPGNVFQFAGRQAIGMANNIDAKALVKSTFWELVILCLGGAILSTLMITIKAPFLNPMLSIGASIIIIGLYLTLLKYFTNREMVKSAIINLTFTFLSGLSFLLLLKVLNFSTGNLHNHEIIGAYILAWLIGLITPGAPAGVGIREVILLYLFKNSINDQDLLLTILLGRMMTVSGDFIFYLIALTCGFLKRGRALNNV